MHIHNACDPAVRVPAPYSTKPCKASWQEHLGMIELRQALCAEALGHVHPQSVLLHLMPQQPVKQVGTQARLVHGKLLHCSLHTVICDALPYILDRKACSTTISCVVSDCCDPRQSSTCGHPCTAASTVPHSQPWDRGSGSVRMGRQTLLACSLTSHKERCLGSQRAGGTSINSF